MRALRVESGRYRHAAEYLVSMPMCDPSRQTALEVSAAAVVKHREIAAGVRNERNRRGLPDLQSRCSRQRRTGLEARRLLDRQRALAGLPLSCRDRTGSAGRCFLTPGRHRQWPLSQRLALRRLTGDVRPTARSRRLATGVMPGGHRAGRPLVRLRHWPRLTRVIEGKWLLSEAAFAWARCGLCKVDLPAIWTVSPFQ